MAAAASSSSIVELCKLADARLDAATSAKFFNDFDDGGAGGAIIISSSSFSWPEAGRTPSTRLFDQSAVKALCEKHKVPSDYIPMSLDGRWTACQTPPEAEGSDTIFVYAAALEAGMRIPLHGFYVEVLGHYGLAPTQLAPDAWRSMAAFVLLSQDAGVEPSLPAFRSFFSICTHDGDSVGWHHFRCRHLLFNGKVPRSPDPEWKSRFFLLRSPPTSPWPCPVKWGKPSRAAVRLPVVTSDVDMVMKKLLDRAGSSGIDLMQFLSRRSPPVAPPPPPPPPPPPTPPPPPPPPQEPTTRKRKSFADTHTQGRGLVHCIAEASEFLAEVSEMAKKAVAEVDEKGKELVATRGEVAQLKEALGAANARLQKQSTHLEKQHTAAVDRLKAEHAVAVARLKDEHRKAEERAAEHHEAEVAKLQDDHADVVARLKEEHAADVTRVKDAADKEVQETKKKIVLRLFPKLDVTLLERPKQLKGDLAAAAATGTPKGERRRS